MVSPLRFRPSAPNPAGRSLRTWLDVPNDVLKVGRTPGEQVVVGHPERSGERLELRGAKRFRGHPEGGAAVFANEITACLDTRSRSRAAAGLGRDGRRLDGDCAVEVV